MREGKALARSVGQMLMRKAKKKVNRNSKDTNTADIITYTLSEHREWNRCEHGYKDTNNADTVTYLLSEHQE